ncbi:DUF6480 family protein [Kitasatospora sp. NPDC059646]|uniref:DUF6480 family protein n=1 Tax=Kitasatospora sp. NPDC059646 TaxID=3346893 RepID=UPI0036A89D10
MTTPDPDPEVTPGLDRGGNPLPGDTPPAEGGTSGISHPEPPELGRATSTWPVVPIVLIALLIATMMIAMLVTLNM